MFPPLTPALSPLRGEGDWAAVVAFERSKIEMRPHEPRVVFWKAREQEKIIEGGGLRRQGRHDQRQRGPKEGALFHDGLAA